MKSASFRHIVAVTAMAGAVLATAPAHAGPFSDLFIFGDSLSDTGNIATVFTVNGLPFSPPPPSGDYVPSAPYLPFGVFSDGPVWATSFSASLGVSAAPSLLGGTNYAYGGAKTGVDGSPALGGVPFSLKTQVNQFLGSYGAAPSDALYVVAGGSNNLRDAAVAFAAAGSFAEQVAVVAAASSNFATDVGGIVDQLQAAGAQNIVVWNVGDLGLTPAAAALGPVAQGVSTLLATTMNDALAYRLQGEAGVIEFDTFGLLQSIVAGAPGNGFLNVADACGFAGNGCDPATALFWDGIHPTAYAHSVLANQMFAAVVPEPATYAMFAFGLAGLLAWSRRRAG